MLSLPQVLIFTLHSPPKLWQSISSLEPVTCLLQTSLLFKTSFKKRTNQKYLKTSLSEILPPWTSTFSSHAIMPTKFGKAEKKFLLKCQAILEVLVHPAGKHERNEKTYTEHNMAQHTTQCKTKATSWACFPTVVVHSHFQYHPTINRSGHTISTLLSLLCRWMHTGTGCGLCYCDDFTLILMTFSDLKWMMHLDAQ